MTCEATQNAADQFSQINMWYCSLANFLFSPGFRDMVVKLRGAFQESKTLIAKEAAKLRFFVNRELETELEVAVSFNW